MFASTIGSWAYLVEKGLEQSERRKNKCVDSKEDIVGADEVVLSVVAVAVLVLDGGAEEEGEVEDRVAEKAQDVEKDKVERQALDRLPSVVKDGLWVETGRPRDKVCPANDMGSERSESSELHGWVILCDQLRSC